MNDKRVKRVAFGDESVLQAYHELRAGRFEERQLAGFLDRAISDLKENPFVGVAVPRRLWPRDYVRHFSIDNLRKYDLPNGWRLIYTLKGSKVEIVSILLEWFAHKEYEKKFNYRVR